MNEPSDNKAKREPEGASASSLLTRDQGPRPTIEAAPSWFARWRLPLLAFFYVLVFVLIDRYVGNVNRYLIFCNLLVVSSLYFSWYLGGRETMLYVAFFNLFFAFIFSRLIYVSDIVAAPLFLGKSFITLYVVTIVFMAYMLRQESPADRLKRLRMENIQNERQRRHQLELMVATQKVSQDVVQQANRVKDELLLLQNSWRSQIHSIINDLSPVKEKELYDQIVRPFQEDIIKHLRKLENRLAFNPRAMTLDELHAYLGEQFHLDARFQRASARIGFDETGWTGNPRQVVVDEFKTWEIVYNLIRNAQTAVELRQIDLMRQGKEALEGYSPEVRVFLEVGGHFALIRVADTGGGMEEEDLDRLFHEPLPSRKRGDKSPGQGTIFVKFFGESMGFDLEADNTTELGATGLEVVVAVPLLD